MNKFHILILSVGSLVGQNILDSLEGRREHLRITGLNIDGDNPRIFRCDKVYQSPITMASDFESFLLNIIHVENPDMILPGRDDDVIILAKLVEDYPQLQSKVPCGSLQAAQIAHRKDLTFQFAKRNHLPYAQSIILDSTNHETVLAWAQEIGFPIIAKPTEGYGSLNVRILCHNQHIVKLLNSNSQSIILQKMYDFDDEKQKKVTRFLDEIDTGVPLFFHLPDATIYAGFTIIHPDGSVGDIYTGVVLLVIGRVEKAEVYQDQALVDITKAYAEAMSKAGWRGFLQLQCKKAEHGYVVIELGCRVTGNASARNRLGYDELRKLIKIYYQRDIGPNPFDQQSKEGVVYRSLTDSFVSYSDQDKFKKEGLWENLKIPF